MSSPASSRGVPTIMVELSPYEKDLIRAHATDLHPEVARQLRDGRFVWIEFTWTDLDDITGALSYICNRTPIREFAEDLDAVCMILEPALRKLQRP